MSKKKGIIIAIIVFIVILLIIGFYFIFKSKPQTKSDAEENLKNPDLNPPIPGLSSGGTSYASAAFPVKRGMSGQLVKDIQSYLASNSACINSFKVAGVAIPAVDGAFGPITEAALKACKGVTVVTQDLYNSMKAAASAPAGSTGSSASSAWKSGDKVYLASPWAVLYSYPSNEIKYYIGRVQKTNFLTNPIGTYNETATGDFVKITVSGYEPYNASTVAYGPSKVETKTVFINKYMIQKTPY